MSQSLQQTVIWQGVILVSLALLWLVSLLIATVDYLTYHGPKSWGAVLYSLLVGLSFFAWAGYTLLQLYKMIQLTQAYATKRKDIYWEEALQYQRLFWKYLLLLLLASIVVFVLDLFFFDSIDLLKGLVPPE